ncbi:MAG TPA: helix-hairpin-helix domain-containing protein [Longimicrobiales bacterium]|nr:helix-hairpin-helix domain-containing protein [Longimicrobiales bacterium]
MDHGGRLRIAVWGALALVAALLAWRALARDGGGAVARISLDGPGAAAASAGASASRSGAPSGRASEPLYVAVAGAVRSPGLVRVPVGARVAVAIERAGGLRRGADLTAVNLAARLRDGQQVVVPRRGTGAAVGGTAGAAVGGTAGAAGGPGGPAGAGGTGARISLGSATLEQLETLDGIGPALAQRIVAYRDAHGGFRSLEELGQVDGIGEKRLAALKAALVP